MRRAGAFKRLVAKGITVCRRIFASSYCSVKLESDVFQDVRSVLEGLDKVNVDVHGGSTTV